MAYVNAECAGRVTIFSTGGKFHPSSNFTLLHTLTLATRSYALLLSRIASFTGPNQLPAACSTETRLCPELKLGKWKKQCLLLDKENKCLLLLRGWRYISHILINLTTPTIKSGHTHFVMFPQYQPQSSRGGSGSLCGEMEGGPRLSVSGSSVAAGGGEEGMGGWGGTGVDRGRGERTTGRNVNQSVITYTHWNV